MKLETSSSLSSVAVAIILACLYVCKVSLSKKNSLPPGPPGEIILGHFRIVPTNNPEYEYMRWSKEYKSDILGFHMPGKTIIVLNSVRAAMDLLDKRGGNYSDRPDFILFMAMGWEKTLTFLRAGPMFKKHRSMLQRAFSKTNIVQFRPWQEFQARIMLKGFSEKPRDWEHILRRFATAVIMGIAHGVKIDNDSSPFIEMAEKASYALGHGGAPAGTPVDYFPFIRHLPRIFHDQTLRNAMKWRQDIRNIHEEPYKAAVSSDERAPSILQGLLDQLEEHKKSGNDSNMTESDVKGAAAAVYAAGQDTVWSSIVVFILNMVLHPEVQSKAQSMIDQVVGRDRLPSYEDRPKLPYVEFIVQETLRWCPVSPLGVPHRAMQDDQYKGYLIPKGALVYANARAMTHDATVYNNPDAFDPDRYIPVADGGRGEPFPVGHFGFGRRKCVGLHLAEASIWIVVVSMLSTFDIKRDLDQDGHELVPKVKLTNGLTSHPERFPCRIIGRDEKAIAMVQAC